MPGKTKISYMSGKSVIKSTSQAAVDACTAMGEQRYLDQVLLDSAMHQHLGVVDELDVGCERDRVKVGAAAALSNGPLGGSDSHRHPALKTPQLASVTGRAPAELGGRNNDWRHLHFAGRIV